MAEAVSNILIRRKPKRLSGELATAGSLADDEVLDEKAFSKMLYLERKRAERSNNRFVLMLLESATLLKSGSEESVAVKILFAVSQSTRETDIKGWHKDGNSIGVIFTEIGAAAGRAVAAALLSRITDALSSVLSIDEIKSIRISFRVFPETVGGFPEDGIDLALYPELAAGGKKLDRLLKRGMDILGSLLALLLLAPAMVAIAIAVKVTSRGPVVFRQRRLGLYGRPFTFLKFRTMYSGNDQTTHKEYTKRLISGADCPDTGVATDTPVYKMKDDPRITPVGRFLRRASLDELPQFVNVLKGEMSLVGPRPPIPYEVEAYAAWHKRRLLLVKPGITGLWQVGGRSRVKFDDMVRLDLRYAKSWSVLEDVKILLRTPRAVVSGHGAY